MIIDKKGLGLTFNKILVIISLPVIFLMFYFSMFHNPSSLEIIFTLVLAILFFVGIFFREKNTFWTVFKYTIVLTLFISAVVVIQLSEDNQLKISNTELCSKGRLCHFLF